MSQFTREGPVDPGLTRRLFLGVIGAALPGTRLHGPTGSPAPPETPSAPNAGRLDLSDLPCFCAHEHWGSIASVGQFFDGFRADAEAGALPARRTTVFDILLDPYFGGWLAQSGVGVDRLAKAAGEESFEALLRKDPAKAFDVLKPALAPHVLGGAFQCIRGGILALYGVDLLAASGEAIASLNDAIGRNYEQLFAWYRRAMERMRFSHLIRPVHPEFFMPPKNAGTAGEELAFTDTVLRIDPLLALWPKECPRRDALAAFAGVEPRDAGSWREFLTRLFDKLAAARLRGIKQLQAYSRDLDFQPRRDSDVVFRGDLTAAQVRVFQDWVANECCAQAHERNWPHQIHVGTHNLPHSSPLPLAGLARRYGRMKIVQLHCWPFLDEAGSLAKQFANVFIDTCWQPVLNPEFLRKSCRAWLGYVPAHKIMCSQDATSVEMAAGSSRIARAVLAEELARAGTALGVGAAELRRLAAGFLNDNAAAVYGIGARSAR
ncbi:MAG TPA: hypothetical protein DCM87_12935 [Planctomycetes bacterium]|nr:hypothetical protein [Planctomycetota bacterium]